MDAPATSGLFLNYLSTERNLAKLTLSAYKSDLKHFAAFLVKKKLELKDLTPSDILSYFSSIAYDAKPRTLARKTTVLKQFFGFLLEEKILDKDPTLNLDSPKLDEPLPLFLSEEETMKLLDGARAKVGLHKNREDICRFWAALEVLYATGARVSELLGLKVMDIDFSMGFIRVHGKGGYERLIPISRTASRALSLYIENFKKGHSRDDYLFVSRRRMPWTRVGFYRTLKKHAREILPNLNFSLSPHKIRHSFATHLLNRGADLKSIQELLGHRKLSTTQIYTHLEASRLKALHKKFHPRG